MEDQTQIGVTSEKWHATKTNMLMSAGTLTTAGILDLITHAGPGGLFFGGLAAFIVARHGDDIANGVRSLIPPELVDAAMKRLPHREVVQVKDERDDVYPRQVQQARDEKLEEWYDYEGDADETLSLSIGHGGNPTIPAQFRLEDVLDAVRNANAKRCIYFGHSASGPVCVPLKDMYHVLDVSSSGKGKSNRFRLAMMQMLRICQVVYINPFAGSVKPVDDSREVEVWQPLYEKLATRRPMKTGADIADMLQSLLNEIERRNEREEQRDFGWKKRPVLVFVDELPEVIIRCPDAIKMIDRISRTGRQFSVFCYIASQTAAVGDIGLSTASQAQFKTLIYGGGDRNSASRMMKGAITKEHETTLHTASAGLTLMFAAGLPGLQFVRAPLVTNEGMFAYLGLPPFVLSEWLAPVRPPSFSPSQANGVSPSVAPSGSSPTVRLAEGVSEAGRRGNEGGEGAEGEQEALTGLERQIGEMFFAKDMNPNAIVSELWPDVKGGAAYQQKAAIVASAIRKVGLR